MAAKFLRNAALVPAKFSWYKVDRAVGYVRHQGPNLEKPIGPLRSIAGRLLVTHTEVAKFANHL